jgi:mycoredoxin
VVTIYSTAWCGYCIRLKRQLERQGVAFTEVDIERDRKSEALVRSVNRGNAVVPTVEFEDGSTLTNPSLRQVLDKLEAAA